MNIRAAAAQGQAMLIETNSKVAAAQVLSERQSNLKDHLQGIGSSQAEDP